MSIVLLAGFARLAAILHFDSLADDQDAYLAIARNIADGNGFCANVGQPTAYRPPLYPLVLAFCLSVGGKVAIGVLHVLLGMLTSALAWKLARLVGLSVLGCAVTAVLVAVDPILVRYSANPMTETLFTVLVVGFVNASLEAARSEKRSLVDQFKPGVWFGLAALCRPSIWAFGILYVVVSFVWHRLGWSQNIAQREIVQREIAQRDDLNPPGNWLNKRRLCPFLAAIVVVSPWVLRNWFEFGRPIVMTTHGGYTLALGNNDSFYENVVQHGYATTWPLPELEKWQKSIEVAMDTRQIPRTDESERDGFHQGEAVSWIKANPKRFLESCVVRQQRFWNPVPNDENAAGIVRFSVGVFYSVQFLFVGMGLFRCGFCKRYPVIIVIIVSFALLHSVYWTNTRMRAPLQPLLALVAAASFCLPNRATPQITP